MKECGALILVITAIYSFGVGVSTQISPLFALPILVLVFLKSAFLARALKALFFLNLFVFFAVLSVLIAANYDLALLIALRANLIMLFNLLLFAGLKEAQIAGLFNELGTGAKFVSLVYFAVFFVGVLRRELEIRLLALKSRGLGRGLFRLKAYANVVAVLVILAFSRASSLERTLRARGFAGQILWHERVKISKSEIFLLLCVIICVILAFAGVL